MSTELESRLVFIDTSDRLAAAAMRSVCVCLCWLLTSGDVVSGVCSLVQAVSMSAKQADATVTNLNIA